MKEKPNLDSIISEIKEIEKDKSKEKEINPELEKLLEYSERIFEIAKEYESVYAFLEPMGVDLETGESRSFNEEFEDFLEKRKEEPDYCLSMYYPELEKIDVEKLGSSRKKYGTFLDLFTFSLTGL